MWKPKKYKFILWDIDDTLIDFKQSEKVAMKRCFASRGITLSDEDIAVYSEINHKYWLMLERDEITKPELLVARFCEFCKVMNLPTLDYENLNSDYQIQLGETAVMNDGGKKLCEDLKECCFQCAVTNGTLEAQKRKLKLTGLVDILDKIFISEEIGIEKPKIEFFNHCFERIPHFDKSKAIIIGDSQTSDIKGGNNIGIDSCWFNKKNQEKNSEIKATYEIKNLCELRDIL